MTINTSEIFLGRQPILDINRKIVAYELLFRSEDSLSVNVVDDLQATSTVIVNTLSQFGLEHVLGGHDAFINVSASLLMSDTIELLPPNRMILEILEDVPISPQILARCQALKLKGFRLCLGDLTNRSGYAPLLPLIDIIKIDPSIIPAEQLPQLLAQIRQRTQAILVAEKVEEESQFKACQALGFSLFQGYFFARPTVLKGKKTQPHQMTLMRIMGTLIGDANVNELEPLFKENPGLTVNLLRLVNSVGVRGNRQEIGSLRQAIVVLGQKQLLRWVQLLLYTESDGPGSGSVMQQVANRARLMELIALKLKVSQPGLSDQAFMVGMLSLVDVVMQVPLQEVLAEIGLTDTINQAILAREGTLGKLLSLAEEIEWGDFVSAKNSLHNLGLGVADFTPIQLEAMQWANELAQ
jgi:EAL and modified HD-GYP domain-containing signal transduction protein